MIKFCIVAGRKAEALEGGEGGLECCVRRVRMCLAEVLRRSY